MPTDHVSTVRPFGDYHQLPVQPTEWALRQQLAAAYRIFDHLGWTYLIYGHISVRVPGAHDQFLINPFGLRYDEVTASNLVKVDLDGRLAEPGPYSVNPAGFLIHSTLHAARPDALCVMHTHTVAGMAMATTRDGLKLLDFAGSQLHGQVGYHAFEGVSVTDAERITLARDLGPHNFLVLQNHGLLTCGPTIASAFRRLYALEMACRVQTAALAMNVPLVEVPAEVATQHASILATADEGELAFTALRRLMEKRDPSFLE